MTNVSTTCAVVIFRFKVSCITSVSPQVRLCHKPRLSPLIAEARRGQTHKITRELWRVYTLVCLNWRSFFFFRKACLLRPRYLKKIIRSLAKVSLIVLKCKAKGTPPLNYTWLKDGEFLNGRRLDPYLNTSIWYLKLKNLEVKDAGQYTCIVSNRYGNINHTYTVTVLGKNTAAYLRFHCRLVVYLSTDSRFLRQFNAHS